MTIWAVLLLKECFMWVNFWQMWKIVLWSDQKHTWNKDIPFILVQFQEWTISVNLSPHLGRWTYICPKNRARRPCTQFHAPFPRYEMCGSSQVYLKYEDDVWHIIWKRKICTISVQIFRILASRFLENQAIKISPYFLHFFDSWGVCTPLMGIHLQILEKSSRLELFYMQMSP